MNDIDTIALERAVEREFGMTLEVGQVIVSSVDVARAVQATVFLTKKKQLLCYITGQSRLTLGDVRKIVSRMGLGVESYRPPKGQPRYFDEVAQAKFSEVFPGRTHITGDDLRFYKTLAPYSPALIVISEIKDGHIYQYDADAHGDWRVAAKFTYRRIKTS